MGTLAEPIETPTFFVSRRVGVPGASQYARFLEHLASSSGHRYDHPRQPATKSTHRPPAWDELLATARKGGVWRGQAVDVNCPAGRGSLVAPPPAASILSTRKAGNVKTRRHANAALTPTSAFGNLPTAARRIPASAKRLRINVLGWVFLGPTPIARNRAHSHRRAPALVSGRPCAGDGIGPILAPRTYSAAPILAPGLRLAAAPHWA